MSSPSLFHPAVSAWFQQSFAAPTAAQARAWPAIKRKRDVLIAAPTGSGKTLAAFLAAIDDLVRQGIKGALPDETQVVYAGPRPFCQDLQRRLKHWAEQVGKWFGAIINPGPAPRTYAAGG